MLSGKDRDIFEDAKFRSKRDKCSGSKKVFEV
jgi:hypothetical protein